MTTAIPKYLCLNGWPKSGKDEVANLFVKHLNAEKVDDGLPLRLAAPHLYGFDPSWPFSQEGKAKIVETPTGPRTVRDLLGTLGNHQEAEFGNGFLPFRALQMAAEVERRLGHEHIFVFPSVRKDQGAHYKAFAPEQTFVMEVSRPGTPPSEYAFDQWDHSQVDAVLNNDGTLEDLEAMVLTVIDFLRSYPLSMIRSFNSLSFKANPVLV